MHYNTQPKLIVSSAHSSFRTDLRTSLHSRMGQWRKMKPKRVAILGTSFRLPGSNSDEFWPSLLAGKNLVTEVADDRWSKSVFLHPLRSNKGTSYTFASGSVGDVFGFDAKFFGISPREAAQMDPQQRLLLEMAWESFENAGVVPSTVRGTSCGVYIGLASADYSFRFVDDLAVIDSATATGNTASIAANRISYAFDLRGPSMAVDTACSSSLVAFHLACRAIANGECTMALTGGISLHLHPYGFIAFSKASMLSKRGMCNVFDARGDGYVRSEGGGIFLLKDYDQAVADGDSIQAVVVNTLVNSDGKKSGLTVPSPKAQAALLIQSYREAGISPEDIDYIEAHGTGTAVGDPIETQALGDALGKSRAADHPLLIGSVKSNVGHLETASGIAGLLKAMYCVQHRVVPATIGIETPNPNIKFDEWNIKVVTENQPLKPNGKLIVGVNSFGFGGANAHVILESPDPVGFKPPKHHKATPLPMMISAKDSDSLKATSRAFAQFLEKQPQAALYDIAYNAAFRREWHEHRAMIYGTTTKAIARALQAFADDKPSSTTVESGVALDSPSGPVFLYSGNGSQWEGMGKRLLDEEPVFREAVREVDVLFQRLAPYSLEDELAGQLDKGRYERTEYAQPALFALQVGVTQMLRHRGVKPVAVAGHSVGEVAAAWASGALTLEAAVSVIYHRSRLQGTTKGQGAMTAVGLGAGELRDLLAEADLSDSLAVAAENSVRGTTLAGDPRDLARIESLFDERKIFFKRLDIDYAFHSPAMDGIEHGIRGALAQLQPTHTLTPFYSTVTGKRLDATKLDSLYWWHNIRKPVLFEQALTSMLELGINVFIEVGPHALLRGYVNDCLKHATVQGRFIATVSRGDDAPQRVWSACKQVAISGASTGWRNVFSWIGPFVPLPNYVWQRERYVHPVTSESHGLLERRKVHGLLGYPLPQHELSWENQLDTQLNPTLADHVIGEATILPGSGLCEIALAAAFAWQAGSVAEIEELEILAPVVLSDEHGKIIRTIIDKQDGRFSILGREHTGTESWNLHAVGRILREPNDRLLQGTAPALPTRLPDFTSASHALLTQEASLNYGPAFQCIEYGWVDGEKVFARLKIPSSIAAELPQSHLHPALLDCTFQLIIQVLKEELRIQSGVAFVPIKMGRVVLRAQAATPHTARATILHRTVHSLTAEFSLFDHDGNTVATISETRFRSARLNKNAADHLRFLSYHGVPKPHPLTPRLPSSVSFERVHATVSELTRRNVLSSYHRRHSEEVDPLLDSLCSRFTRQAFQQLCEDGAHLTTEDIARFQATQPEIEPFLGHLLSMAQDDQSIIATERGWELAAELEHQASAEDIWNSLVADYPDYFQIVHSVGRIGMHLSSLLRGRVTLSAILPKESSIATLTRQVLGAASRQKIGNALRTLISQGVKGLQNGARLRIVEISEGTPAFTVDAGVSMNENCCDYLFASTNATTLEETARVKERFPGIESCLIGSPDARKPTDQLYEIALLTLDFSSAEAAISALDFARKCLAPDGVLLVIGQHPSRWIDFVFGADRQHWSRSNQGSWLSNQRTAAFWKQELQRSGFKESELFEFAPDTLSGPYLILSKPATESAPKSALSDVTPRSWIVLADREGFSAKLSDRLTSELQGTGDLVVQACPGNLEQLTTLFGETTASYGELDGIVYLAGLRPQLFDAKAKAVVELQVERCTTVANIVRACEATLTKTSCWLVTSDAISDLLLRDSINTDAIPSAPAPDSAVWGFGRTLSNEASNYSVHLVDLEGPPSVDTVACALARELQQPDVEQEFVITKTGERYVPRLRFVARPQVSKQRELETPTLRLGFQFPGQLRNLRWEALPRRAPAADEVEVEVYATGLNFRDVMYALGLLSDEAIENGFAGPTLGLEFSGIVQRVGDKGCGFAPGDQVVGFGPSSFGNRVITKATAISAIPPGITFEAAATIPSTFFTVYYSLHYLARLQPGEKVLIHGAAGGVGIAAIQLAKWIGAEIYATAGSDEKRDFLRLLGIDHVFDSRTLSFADDILASTNGEGVDVVLNSLAGEAINRNFRVLRPFGRFLELGKRDFYENTKIGLRPFRNNISYFGIDADQLMHSRPDLTQRLFSDLMALFAEGVIHPLPYHAFDAEDIVDAFRYMQQARQIGKIVITYRNGISHVHTPPTHADSRVTLSPDASYLVTGGLNGFGLRTAEWLADRGARNLILISRSGKFSEEAKPILARLHRQGVRTVTKACDVTDKAALSDLMQETAVALPPLKGVIHAATIIKDGLIRNMSAEDIRSVLEPKMLGAQYLHELTLKCSLDFFVLFSSATTLLGNPGQANYVAANSYLEALTRYRRARGLPATCVCWGAIDDAGFLARNEKIKAALLSRMGGAAIKSALALDILEAMLLSNQSEIGVMDFSWKALSRFLPSASTPRFSELARVSEENDHDDENVEDVQRLLTELPENELLSVFKEMLKSEVGEILRVPAERIDADRSIYEMGLDSLMGVELVVALESRFGTRLPVMTLSQSPTISKLAERIVQQLKGGDSAEDASPGKDLVSHATAVAAQHGVDASQETIASLAENIQKQDTTTIRQMIR